MIRLCVLLLFLSLTVSAQITPLTSTVIRKSTLPNNYPSQLINLKRSSTPFQLNFSYVVDESHKGQEDEYLTHIQDVKDMIEKRFKTQQNSIRPSVRGSSNFFQGTCFAVPPHEGFPISSRLAVSKGNFILHIERGNILHIFSKKGQLFKTIHLELFREVANTHSEIHSASVLYDPNHNRFIVGFLAGNRPSNSHIILAFSQDDNPLDRWSVYEYYGNADFNNHSVHVKNLQLAITQGELFFTVDVFRNKKNKSWKSNFKETQIWQLGLAEAFAHQPLQCKVWHSLDFPVKGLLPIRGGYQPEGPNAYFLSTRFFDVENDSLFLLEITDSLKGNPELNATLIKLPKHYITPPRAAQRIRNYNLATADTRIQDAFYANNQIQFVLNTLDKRTGRSGIYHGILDSLATRIKPRVTIISDPLFYLAYPSIAPAGRSVQDSTQSSLIVCLHSASNVYAGSSGFHFDGKTHSRINYIREGEQSLQAPKSTRLVPWGSQTQLCRDPKEKGRLWAATQFANSNRMAQGWITQLSAEAGIDRFEQDAATYKHTHKITLPFEIPDDRYVNIRLVQYQEDTDSELTKEIFLEGYLRYSGRAIFQCVLDHLDAGTYRVLIENREKEIADEQIIIEVGKS